MISLIRRRTFPPKPPRPVPSYTRATMIESELSSVGWRIDEQGRRWLTLSTGRAGKTSYRGPYFEGYDIELSPEDLARVVKAAVEGCPHD
jgi:hypothetical protein